MRPFLTLHHPAAARRYYEQGVWQSDTFYALMARHAAERPDAPALQDGQRTLTWQRAAGMGRWRRRRPAAPRARPAATACRSGCRTAPRRSSRSSPARARASPAIPRCTAPSPCGEIGTLLERLSARALLTEPGWGADRARADFDDGPRPASRSLKAVVHARHHAGAGARTTALPCSDPDKVAYLAFTSGTTGAPKCVMHSDNTLLANARDLVRDWGHGPRHGAAQPLAAVAPHRLGRRRAVAAGRLPVRHQRSADRHQRRSTGSSRPAPPTSWACRRTPWTCWPSRRRAASSGWARSACSTWRARRSRRRWRPAFVAQGIKPQNIYGMTENSSHQYTHPDDDTGDQRRHLRARRAGLRGAPVRSGRSRPRRCRSARWARSAAAAAR